MMSFPKRLEGMVSAYELASTVGSNVTLSLMSPDEARLEVQF